MKFEIRHAYEGHSQSMLLQRTARGEAIMLNIQQMYKISFKDQMLITKSGRIIDPNSPLQRGIIELDDKTITSFEYKHETENKTQKLPCVYLFNLKELCKVGERYERRPKEYWGEQLLENMKELKKIKTTVSPYDSLEQLCTGQQLKTYQKYVSRINSLKAAYQKLASEYSDLKESSYKVEGIIDRCSNQKKAGISLLKSIKEQGLPLSEKMNYIGTLKQKLTARPIAQDRSLRENSGFFENQKNSSIYQSNYKVLKERVEMLILSIKDQLKKNKQKFRDNQPKFMSFGSIGYSQKIDSLQQINRKSYDQVLTLFKQLVQKAENSSLLETKLASLEENARNSLFKDLQNMMVEITNTYIAFCQYNEENKFKLKETYSVYRSMIKDLKAYYVQATSLQKEILLQLERQEKAVSEESRQELHFSSKKISKDESQAQRRLHFNKVINFIQSLASKLCEEEEILRKKFVSEAKGNDKHEYECLKNAKVPEVDIQDNSSSDKELWKLIRANNEIAQRKLTLQQFVLYNYNIILEKVKSANTNETNTKIKNLEEILKRAVEILPKIYNNKIQEILKDKQVNLQKIPQLQQTCKSLQAQIQQQKKQILEFQRRLSQKQQLMIVRQRQRCEEINKERSKYEKLYLNFKELQASLTKQSQINEQLCNQIVRVDEEAKHSAQMNGQLKEMLALKELEIIAIEKKMQGVGKEEKYVEEEDLKSAVLNNFSKDIKKDEEKDQEIQRLNQQILILQRENQELEEEYDQLNAEMRKIITKETYDIQTQTNTEESSEKVSDNDHISISEEITVGQNALFMPFSSNTYVGVTHKDDDRTISNINRIQPNNYLLDISSFSLKIKDLLTQCSFLVVIQVSNLSREGKNIMVKGTIKNLLGFEDDNLTVKNYAQLLPHPH